MAFQRTLHHVKKADLDRIVGDFESEGAIVDKIEEEGTNPVTWTVVATFP